MATESIDSWTEATTEVDSWTEAVVDSTESPTTAFWTEADPEQATEAWTESETPPTPAMRAMQIRKEFGVDNASTMADRELYDELNPSAWDKIKGHAFNSIDPMLGAVKTVYDAHKLKKRVSEMTDYDRANLAVVAETPKPEEAKALKRIREEIYKPGRKANKEKYDAIRQNLLKEYGAGYDQYVARPSFNVIGNIKKEFARGRRTRTYDDNIQLANLQELIENHQLALETGTPADTKDFLNQLTKNQKILDVIPFSPTELIRMAKLNIIVKKEENGEEISELEYAQLDEFALDNDLKAKFGQTTGAGITEGVLAMFPYAVEFMTSAGMASSARRTVRHKVGRFLIAKAKSGTYGGRAIKPLIKGAMRAGGGVAAAGTRTFVWNEHRVISGTLRRRLNQVETRDGRAVININVPRKSVLSSFLNSAGETFTGQLSEEGGDVIMKGLSKLSPTLRQKLTKLSLFKTWQTANPKLPKSAFVKRMNKLGKTGIVGEWSEERYNAVLNEVMGIDKDERGDSTRLERLTYRNFEQFLVEAGVLTVGGGPVTVVSAVQRRNANADLERQIIKGYGVDVKLAREYRKKLREAESKEESEEILKELEAEIAERVSKIINPKEGAIAPLDSTEWTIEDAEQIAKSSTPEEIKEIVAESLPESQKELEALLLDPTEETLGAFNAKIQEQDEVEKQERLRQSGIVPSELAEDVPIDIDGAVEDMEGQGGVSTPEGQPVVLGEGFVPPVEGGGQRTEQQGTGIVGDEALEDVVEEAQIWNLTYLGQSKENDPTFSATGVAAFTVLPGVTVEAAYREAAKAEPQTDSPSPEAEAEQAANEREGGEPKASAPKAAPDSTGAKPSQNAQGDMLGEPAEVAEQTQKEAVDAQIEQMREEAREFYHGLETIDIAARIGEHQAYSEDIPDALQEEFNARLKGMETGMVDALDRIIAETKAAIREMDKESATAKIDAGIDLSKPTVSEAVGRLIDIGVARWYRALNIAEGGLRYGYENSDTFRSAVEAYTKKSGKTFDYEYPILLTSNARERINEHKKALEKHVTTGNVEETREALIRLGIDPEKTTGLAYLFAAHTYAEASRLAETEKRVETSNLKPPSQENVEPPSQENAEPTAEETTEEQDPDAGLPPIVRERIEEILLQYRSRIGYQGMGLSDAEAAQMMRYAAFMQKYDELVGEEKFEDLPKAAQEMVTNWLPVANEINDILLYIKDAHGVPHEGLAGFYYPLRHFLGNANMAKTNLEDAMLSTHGVSTQRKGNYDGVVENPEAQLDAYLTDVARRTAIAEEMTRQKNTMAMKSESVATAVEKQDKGEELNDIDQEAIESLETYQKTANHASKFGFPKPAEASTGHYRSIAMLKADGRGREINNLRGSLAIDPHNVAAWMDDIDGKNEHGRYYGANTRLFDQFILRPEAESRNIKAARIQEQASLLKGMSTKEKKEVAARIHDAFFADWEVQRILLRAKTVEEIEKYTTLKGKDAEIALYHFRMLHAAAPSVALARDIESETSKLSREQRIDFFRLSRSMQEGTKLTKEEIQRYYDYGIKGGKVTAKGIRRQLARFLFEQSSFDDKDFFGYFESIMSLADKGKNFSKSVSRIEAWADHLESIGQPLNAEWWRSRVESGIKGNAYKFEDTILEHIAMAKEVKRLKKEGKTTGKKGKELPREDVEAMADSLTLGEMKLGMKTAMQHLQRARVNQWLVGNYGWMLTTQLTSIALTVSETGITDIGKAIGLMVGGDAEISEALASSIVTQIKKHRKGAQSFEAMGDIEQTKVVDTRRAKLRNIASNIPSMVETKLTEVSFIAGYIYAKETLKLSEEEARIHGDYVAATTQSMYDRTTRNGALNSDLLRAFSPMQSYTFTVMSHVLKTMGKTGKKLPAIEKLRQIVSFILTQKIISILYSMAFGDDAKKAFLDPEFNKGTLGSAVPVFGKVLDYGIDKMNPLRDPDFKPELFAPLKFGSDVSRVVEGIAEGKEHSFRELLLLLNSYGTGLTGIPAGTAFNNYIRLESARQNNYRFENIDGSLNSRHPSFIDPTPMRWAGGIMFGLKAVDGAKEFDKDKSGGAWSN